MTDIRLAFDKDADAIAFYGEICLCDESTWLEVALEKETAIKLRDGLNEVIDKWGQDDI